LQSFKTLCIYSLQTKPTLKCIGGPEAMPLPKAKTVREQNYLKKIYLVFGSPKVGKSTVISNLGDDNNKILFFATEAGHKELELYKWQADDGSDPTTWEQFKQCVLEMTKQQEFKCLAIDTADNLVDWCAKYVNKKNEIEHESELGFGRGYAAIKKEFMAPINYLSQKGYGIIFVSHSKVQDLELGNRKISYTDSTLNNTAKKIIHGLCDYILHFYVDLGGKRMIRTKGTETVNAGDRSGRLPEVMPLGAEMLKQELQKTN